MKNFTFIVALFSLFSLNVLAQNKYDLKLNLGFANSSPLYDLNEVAGNGHELQPHISLEAKLVKIPYGKEADLGLKICAVGGIEWANFLSNDALTELNISNPHVKARIYPLSYNKYLLGDDSFFHNQAFVEKMPFPIDLLFLISEALVINSLHFDYGKSFATIEEVAFIDDYNFAPETVHRTMTYTGWGFQPQIYQSENEKFMLNGFFDFGKYKWTNANGGTSGMKTSNLGFGAQYNF